MGFFTGDIIQAICWTLLHSLWQGLLLAVVTGVVMVLSKKSGSALRYRLLSAIFVSFIVVVGITFSMQLHSAQARTQLAAQIATNHDAFTTAANPQSNNAVYAPLKAESISNFQIYIHGFVEYFNEHASLIVTVWFIIFMARCVKILSGLVYIQRIRHYKTNDAPEFWRNRIAELANSLQIKRYILLLESAIVKVPVVVGFLKPTILIPVGLLNNLSQQEVESILIHELAHIRRKDYFFNLLQCFIDVLFFFNPAVLWISSLIRAERENCCDDIAISETKSKKQFIQALVSFHQYNSSAAPAKYAMPFAARQNKLVNRVKRIVNNNNHTLNPVEKIVLLVCLMVFSVTFLTVSNGQTSKPKKQIEKQARDSTAKSSASNVGITKPTVKSTPKPKPHVDSTAGAPEPSYAQDDNASTSQSNSGQTNVESYIDGLQAQGYKNLSVDQLIYLKSHGVDGRFIKSFADAGYGKITLEQAVQLKNHGISVEYIKSFEQAGFKNIPLEEAISLRNHGVSPEYINQLKQAGAKDITLEKATEYRNQGLNADYINGFREAGYNVTLDEALQLRSHNVTVQYINELKQAGAKNLTLEKATEYRNQGLNADYINSFRDAGYNVTLDEALQLRSHGVSVQYINELKQAGAKNLTLEKATEYRNQGLSADYVNSFRNAGYKDMTLDEALQLRNHGVSINYINELKEAGVKDVTLEKATEYRDRGVNGSFIKSFSEAGFKDVTPEKAMELREHGVSVEYIKGLNEAGYKDITPQQAMRLRDHGVSPEYITSIRSLGISDLTLDRAVQLRDHSISVDYVKSFAKIGIKDLTLDKAIQLRDHGVTADFIERIRKKTGNDFTLEEYMKLKEVF